MAISKAHVPRAKNRGFSLLELLAVVTIMGIIAAVVIPRLTQSTITTKENGELKYRSDLNRAIEEYYFDLGAYPPDIDSLHTSGYYPTAIPLNPATNAPFEIDGVTHRVKK